MLTLTPYLTTTLKTYLQEFLLPPVYHVWLSEKKYKIQPKYEIHLEEAKQASEPSRAGILELSGQEFKTTMIHMLRAHMDKVDSMQEKMGNVAKKEPRRKTRDNTVTEMKNASNGLI